MQTLSEENYLKIIYNLDKQGVKKVTPTAIAKGLLNNPASVIDMLKKLAEKKMITYEKVKGAKLTSLGKSIAVSVIRRHRLWEVFLSEKLAYEWDQVHDIAEQLEHVHSPELADRLDDFLGYPQFDPHGDPIPSANGEIATLNRLTLEEALEGKTYKVIGVRDSSPEFLQYLKKLGIGIGTKIMLIEKISFDNSAVIEIGKKNQATVSSIFSQNLLIYE